MRRSRVVVMVTAALLAVLAACGGGDESSDKQQLTVYSSLNPEVSEAILEAFEAEYPDIEVSYMRLSTGPLTVRYEQEQEAGVVAADVVMAADRRFFEQGVADGWFATVGSTLDNIDEWPADALVDDAFIKVSTAPAGVTINTDLVKGDDIPTEWADLLDPKFTGKILLADPRAVPTNMFLLSYLGQELGEDFLTGLAGQNLQVVPSAVPGSQQLAAGEASILFPNIESVTKALKDEGAPVDTVFLSPTTGFEMYMGLSEKAKNPDAARLFAEFLISEKGQAALNAAYLAVSPLGDDIDGAVPEPEGFVTPDFSLNDQLGAATLELLGIPPAAAE